MINHIPCYVITVSNETDRQLHITQEFNSQNIDFEFFSAVTPSTIQSNLEAFDFDLENIRCSLPELSCLLSHAILWQKLVDSSNAYMAIFEDDVCIGKQAKNILNNPEILVTNEIQILKLEKVARQAHLTNEIKISELDRSIFTLKSRHLGAAGYIISRAGALSMLNYINTVNTIEAVDILLFDIEKHRKKFLIHQLLPAIVIQYRKIHDDKRFNSCLEGERAKEIKIELSITSKLKREVLRAIRPIYMRKISFK